MTSRTRLPQGRAPPTISVVDRVDDARAPVVARGQGSRTRQPGVQTLPALPTLPPTATSSAVNDNGTEAAWRNGPAADVVAALLREQSRLVTGDRRVVAGTTTVAAPAVAATAVWSLADSWASCLTAALRVRDDRGEADTDGNAAPVTDADTRAAAAAAVVSFRRALCAAYALCVLAGAAALGDAAARIEPSATSMEAGVVAPATNSHSPRARGSARRRGGGGGRRGVTVQRVAAPAAAPAVAASEPVRIGPERQWWYRVANTDSTSTAPVASAAAALCALVSYDVTIEAQRLQDAMAQSAAAAAAAAAAHEQQQRLPLPRPGSGSSSVAIPLPMQEAVAISVILGQRIAEAQHRLDESAAAASVSAARLSSGAAAAAAYISGMLQRLFLVGGSSGGHSGATAVGRCAATLLVAVSSLAMTVSEARGAGAEMARLRAQAASRALPPRAAQTAGAPLRTGGVSSGGSVPGAPFALLAAAATQTLDAALIVSPGHTRSLLHRGTLALSRNVDDGGGTADASTALFYLLPALRAALATSSSSIADEDEQPGVSGRDEPPSLLLPELLRAVREALELAEEEWAVHGIDTLAPAQRTPRVSRGSGSGAAAIRSDVCAAAPLQQATSAAAAAGVGSQPAPPATEQAISALLRILPTSGAPETSMLSDLHRRLPYFRAISRCIGLGIQAYAKLSTPSRRGDDSVTGVEAIAVVNAHDHPSDASVASVINTTTSAIGGNTAKPEVTVTEGDDGDTLSAAHSLDAVEAKALDAVEAHVESLRGMSSLAILQADALLRRAGATVARRRATTGEVAAINATKPATTTAMSTQSIAAALGVADPDTDDADNVMGVAWLRATCTLIQLLQLTEALKDSSAAVQKSPQDDNAVSVDLHLVGSAQHANDDASRAAALADRRATALCTLHNTLLSLLLGITGSVARHVADVRSSGSSTDCQAHEPCGAAGDALLPVVAVAVSWLTASAPRRGSLFTIALDASSRAFFQSLSRCLNSLRPVWPANALTFRSSVSAHIVAPYRTPTDDDGELRVVAGALALRPLLSLLPRGTVPWSVVGSVASAAVSVAAAAVRAANDGGSPAGIITVSSEDTSASNSTTTNRVMLPTPLHVFTAWLFASTMRLSNPLCDASMGRDDFLNAGSASSLPIAAIPDGTAPATTSTETAAASTTIVLHWDDTAGAFKLSHDDASRATVQAAGGGATLSGRHGTDAVTIMCRVCRSTVIVPRSHDNGADAGPAAAMCDFCGAEVGSSFEVAGHDDDANGGRRSSASSGHLFVSRDVDDGGSRSRGFDSDESDNGSQCSSDRGLSVSPPSSSPKTLSDKALATSSSAMAGLSVEAPAPAKGVPPRSTGVAGDANLSAGASAVGRSAQPAVPVILDGPNVAMRAGGADGFVAEGIAAAARYFAARGHPVTALLPESTLDPEVLAARRRAVAKGQAVPAVRLPDDPQLLKQLVASGVITLVKGGEFDEAAVLRVALSRPGAVVISNDRFRDWVKSLPDSLHGTAREWLRTHVLSVDFLRVGAGTSPASGTTSAAATSSTPAPRLLARGSLPPASSNRSNSGPAMVPSPAVATATTAAVVRREGVLQLVPAGGKAGATFRFPEFDVTAVASAAALLAATPRPTLRRGGVASSGKDDDDTAMRKAKRLTRERTKGTLPVTAQLNLGNAMIAATSTAVPAAAIANKSVPTALAMRDVAAQRPSFPLLKRHDEPLVTKARTGGTIGDGEPRPTAHSSELFLGDVILPGDGRSTGFPANDSMVSTSASPIKPSSGWNLDRSHAMLPHSTTHLTTPTPQLRLGSASGSSVTAAAYGTLISGVETSSPSPLSVLRTGDGSKELQTAVNTGAPTAVRSPTSSQRHAQHQQGAPSHAHPSRLLQPSTFGAQANAVSRPAASIPHDLSHIEAALFATALHTRT